MNKPEWSEAPEWAQYLAQDADGEWYWFELQPSKESEYWFLASCVGQSQRVFAEPWTRTLEPRP